MYYNNLCSNTEREVILYRTALLEYIYSGRIYLSGARYSSKADRAEHLKQLLKRSGACTLKILNDENPLLYRKGHAAVGLSQPQYRLHGFKRKRLVFLLQVLLPQDSGAVQHLFHTSVAAGRRIPAHGFRRGGIHPARPYADVGRVRHINGESAGLEPALFADLPSCRRQGLWRRRFSGPAFPRPGAGPRQSAGSG